MVEADTVAGATAEVAAPVAAAEAAALVAEDEDEDEGEEIRRALRVVDAAFESSWKSQTAPTPALLMRLRPGDPVIRDPRRRERINYCAEKM